MGSREFAFATRTLRDGRMMRAFTHFVAVACFLLAVLCIVTAAIPVGPDTLPERAVLVTVAVSAVLVGIRWLWVPWPRYGPAVAFVVWADAAVTLFSVVMSTSEARLSSTLYMGLIGVFAAFLLGPRILLPHCVFGALVITTITVQGVASGIAPSDLIVFALPALAWVVVVPLGGCVLITSGRRALRATVRSAESDPLTGLRNRRGMLAAFGRALRGAAEPLTVAVAVFDIDEFKQLNDTHGHTAGDGALIELARRLGAVAQPSEIPARIGGDELMLVGLYPHTDDINGLMCRLAPLTRVAGSDLTVSIGVASAQTDAQHFLIDDLIRHADTAMYEAKRAGGGRCSVYSRPRVEG